LPKFNKTSPDKWEQYLKFHNKKYNISYDPTNIYFGGRTFFGVYMKCYSQELKKIFDFDGNFHCTIASTKGNLKKDLTYWPKVVSINA
jgi:hypothetical protein